MDNQKEIIEFEDLFKEEIKKRNEPPKPEDSKNYIKTIFTYIIVMFFLNAIISIAFQSIPGTTRVYEKDEILIEKIASDPSGIALMDSDDFDMYRQEYLGYVESLYNYEGLSIVYNTANTYIDGLLLIRDDAGNLIDFDEATFLLIYQNNEFAIDYWDQDQVYEITRYQHNEQTLPSYFLTDDINLIENAYRSFTLFSQTVYQLVLYAILFASIYMFMRNDVVYDFNKFKQIKSQWFVIIVLGYLYVLIGNYLASFISGLLSDYFNVMQSEAVNQMTIVKMLNSNGVVFMFISAVILGPIVEELVFRKSIFGLIKNDKLALAVSMLIFGGIHITLEPSIQSALINGSSYFIMGFVFGYIYLKNNKNIIAPIAVHIIVNLVGVLGSIFLI